MDKFKEPFGFVLKIIFILPSLLVGCGGGSSNSSGGNSQVSQETVFFNLPDPLTNNLSASGLLQASISVNGGNSVPMTISADKTTATATLNNVPVGNANIAITFTYDNSFSSPLVIASLDKNFTITTAGNNISIQPSDFLTLIHDEDGDGKSNLDELAVTSNTSPFVPTCVLGSVTLGNCEL